MAQYKCAYDYDYDYDMQSKQVYSTLRYFPASSSEHSAVQLKEGHWHVLSRDV